MADISKINLSGAVYNIKDATARANLNEIQNISNAEIDEITDFALEELELDNSNDIATAVTSWLDAHPEATTTVEDGSVTADKLTDAVRKGYVRSFETVTAMQTATDLKAGMICHTSGFHTSGDGGAAYYTVSTSGTANGMDVLALQGGLFAMLQADTNMGYNIIQYGADANGQTDCSAIINYVTAIGDVFLPDGSYLVSSSIVLSNDIRGNSNTRAAVGGGAIIMSGLSSGTLISFADITQNFSVENITIQASSETCSIDCNTDGSKRRFSICGVSINNVSSIGLKVTKGDTFASRGVFIDGLSIIGNNEYPSSTGIYFDGRNGDNRINNVEIMGCKVGIEFIGGIYYGDNIHVWCGALKQVDSDGWFAGTVGIRLNFNAKVNINNLYLDTIATCIGFRKPSSGENRNILNVTNFVYWEDSSVDNVTHAGTLVFDATDYSFTHIVNGVFYIRDGGHMQYITNNRLYIDNPTLINQRAFSADNWRNLMVGQPNRKPNYYISLANPADSTRYYEIARLFVNRGGLSIFDVIANNGGTARITLTVSKDSTFTITKEELSGNNTIYYKFDSTTKIIKLYVYVGASATTGRTINTITQADWCGVFDFNSMQDMTLEYETDTSALTAIQTT